MPAPDSPVFQLRSFGAACLERRNDNGWDVVLRAGKPLALLIYLSSSAGRAMPREQLADLLWGDESPENARASLRQAVYALRQILGDDVLVSDRDTVSVVAGAITSDREALLQAARRGDFPAMLGIGRGEFCEFTLAGGASEFERWVYGERLRFDSMIIGQANAALPRLAVGEPGVARAAAVALADRYPSRSDIAALCFDTLATVGALAEASERLGEHYAWLVSQDISMPPMIGERLARMRRAALEPPSTLPDGVFAVGRQCIGREALLQDLAREAETARGGEPRRLLLVGPAGVGKTRVLDELEARLKMVGTRVLRVGFLPGMADVEYVGLVELVRALSHLPGALGIAERSARRLLAVVPELAERFPGAARDGALSDDGLRGLSEALGDLMAAVSEDRLVVLMVDNMHFADLASLRVFAASLLRPGSRLLAVGTSRVSVSPSLAADGTVVVEVLPLTEAQLRAMLSGVATLPAERWVDELVATLLRRSRGIPQVALATMRSLGAASLLRVADGAWQSAAPEALLEMARETAGTGSIIAGLDAASRLLLEVLAVWGRPMGEADLMGTLGLAEPPVAVDVATTRLRRLEALGLVQLRDETWEIAHDTVAEELARSAAPVQGVSAPELLLRYFGTPERLSVGVLEQLAFVTGREPVPTLATRLVAVARRAPALRTAGVRGLAIAQRVARAAGRPEWERPLAQRLGFFGRRSESERVLLAVVATAMTAVLVVLLAMLQPRLVLESEPMVEADEPGAPSALVVQPRLVLRNGFGRDLAWDVTVRVRTDHGQMLGDTRRQMQDGRVQFERLSLLRGPYQTPPRDIAVIFEGPWYVRGTRSHPSGLNTAQVDDEFRIVSLQVNRQPLPDSLVLVANLRDSLRFDLTFEYTTVHATANYIVGAMPLWVPRERAAIRLAGLPRPVFRAWRSVTFAVAPPAAPGVHHLVILMDLEDSVDHMFAATSWRAGVPRWNDGDDLPDQPVETWEQLRRSGTATYGGKLRPTQPAREGGYRAGDSIRANGPSQGRTRQRETLRGRAIRIEFRAD